MLGADDNELRSYLEIVDALRQNGAEPGIDIRGLWRRIVFNVLISNTDDHLRNHGFLYERAKGWRLSPAYDLNPVPVEVFQSIIGRDHVSTIQPRHQPGDEVAEYLDLVRDSGPRHYREVGTAVLTRCREAVRLGISPGN